MMEEEFDLSYKEEIEKIKNAPNFEELGDAKYLAHQDRKARATWAFYRPSGSHPLQIEDEDVYVSIMAFNQSRLRPYERFKRLHPLVAKDEKLRGMIEKRARMLFRALADDDFRELVATVSLLPVYIPLAIDQICNGRILNEESEIEIDLESLTKFLYMLPAIPQNLQNALNAKLKSVKTLSAHELKQFYASLREKKESLHPFVIDKYERDFEEYLTSNNLHPLQKAALKKECKIK